MKLARRGGETVIDGRTISELEAAGFTHVKALCAKYGSIAKSPFGLLRGLKNVDE